MEVIKKETDTLENTDEEVLQSEQNENIEMDSGEKGEEMNSPVTESVKAEKKTQI